MRLTTWFLILAFVQQLSAQAGKKWIIVDSLKVGRSSHATAELPDKRILVSGGGYSDFSLQSCSLNSTEIFDPITTTWVAADPMLHSRERHTVNALQKTGIIVVGGYYNFYQRTGNASWSQDWVSLRSCEIYDMKQHTWVPTDSLSIGRAEHSSTTLLDSSLLISGGVYRDYHHFDVFTVRDSSQILKDCEIFDPLQKKWRIVASLNIPRYDHTSTLLADGRVLVVGGKGTNGSILNSSELFDPVSNTWELTDTLGVSRFGHTSTLLPNRRVLVSGGPLSAFLVQKSAEVFDPQTKSWQMAAPMLIGRIYHQSVMLPDSNILIVGGLSDFQAYQKSCELYDYRTNSWTSTSSMTFARYSHTATLTGNNVLVVGGYPFLTVQCELYISGITDVPRDKEISPSSFQLRQNYPNPFNPKTIIEYSLSKHSHVRIMIVDMLGRRLRTLVDEDKTSGTYKLGFDAKDLPSGLYFYRLQTNEFSQTRKLVLLK